MFDTASEPGSPEDFLMRDLAKLIYEMLAESDDGKPLSDEKINLFMSELSEKLYKEYPYYKKLKQENKTKKVIFKSKTELYQEAKTV
jgi:hypothetical protein